LTLSSVTNSIIISRANKNTNRKWKNNTNKNLQLFPETENQRERTKQYQALNQKIGKQSENIMKSKGLSHTAGCPR